MFRIRRVFDDLLPVDRQAIAQVQDILARQFPLIAPKEVRDIPANLRDPLKHRFRSILYVAESRREIRGFALMLHVPDCAFCYLDYVSARPGGTGGGVGGALYQRARDEALSLDAVGLFFECPSDDPAICLDKEPLKANRARLRFYERFGARPIVDTAYETPLTPGGDTSPPVLVYDPLGRTKPLRRDTAQTVVRAVLERKYGHRCPPGYIDMVLASFRHDPVRIRAPRYVDAPPAPPVPSCRPCIALTVNDKHDIHHVHERGYVESPARVRAILKRLMPSGMFEQVAVRHFSERHILAVHDKEMVAYFKRACAGLKEGESLYPYVFPIRNAARPPKDLPVRAGYYCIDTFTPLNRNAYLAAQRAVDCGLTAADTLLTGRRLAYALVRPPGHHAERRSFGGFCYFNTAAVAAQFLCAHGKVAILDMDYHHGNGAQDIFYERPDVLTLSIHGHPSFAYPYFSGFAEERGAGPGLGYNRNYPLGEIVDGPAYRTVLARALERVRRFKPLFLIIALGLDTARNDPTGTWTFTADDFFENGLLAGGLGLPTLVAQEGGYRIPSLGANARRFFDGLRQGMYGRTRPLVNGKTLKPNGPRPLSEIRHDHD
ncbi:MAG: histone deacetylase family protein [Desulfovibrionaceae bacterium]